MSDSDLPASAGPGPRPSGVPYPEVPPLTRDDLPDRGLPGAPAAWGLRAAARMIDFLLFSLLFGYIAALFGTGSDDDGNLTGPKWPLLLFPVFFILYETIALSFYGQTLGKWVCQIKAVDYRRGDLVEISGSAIRAFVPGSMILLAAVGQVIDVPFLIYFQFVAIIIYLASLADILYRGPHDKAGGTIVLAAPRQRRQRNEP